MQNSCSDFSQSGSFLEAIDVLNKTSNENREEAFELRCRCTELASTYCKWEHKNLAELIDCLVKSSQNTITPFLMTENAAS